WSAVYQWRTSQRTPADAQRVIPQLNAARRLCPTYAPLYSVLGQIEFDALDQPIGVTHLHQGAELDRCDPTTYYLAGRVAAERGNFVSAVPLLRRAVELDYTVMYDVNRLALTQLHKPELAIAVAGESWYRLIQLGNAMSETEEYRNRADSIRGRAADFM